MNDRRSQILLKVIDEFFEKEIGETEERFRKHLLEICRKEKASVEKGIFCYVFILFVVDVLITICDLLCFTITNQKLENYYLLL